MNKNPVSISSGIDAILDGALVQSRHVLFLYTSNVNRYAIQSSFFAMSNKDEHLLYITDEEPSLIMSKFEVFCPGLSILHPENMDDLKMMSGRLRILMDGVSTHESLMSTSKMDDDLWVHQRLEEFLSGNKNNIALCMYNLATLPYEQIQKLADSHDRMILSTPDMTLLSAAFFDKYNIADATIERFVREYLDVVVLALIAGKPMCGTDIIDSVHKNFNVLLSPGTIYPLLHRLKKEGLLQCEYGIKKKVYKPAKDSTANIRNILNEHLLANDIINGFLTSKFGGEP
ncbi:MAG: PadR family transcriptional regulator [Candidatus Methanoperedens sp.]|nr:PadR family transcriptional regulator [Candidatus Methanoperedens sp.]